MKYYKIYAAQVDAYHRVMVGSSKIERTINVHDTGSVMRNNVSWIDLQSFKVNT